MDFERLKKDILKELEEKLPGEYYYHDVRHTREVMDYVKTLGREAKLSPHEQLLLDTAAVLHDYGYLTCYGNHEDEGATAAEQILPGYGYEAEDIKKISDMIRATKLVRKPANRLEGLLRDADIGYIGSDGFLVRANDYRREISKINGPLNDREWNRGELNFLISCKFYAPESEKLLGKGLAENIERLRKELGDK